MQGLAELKGYARFARRLPRFLRERITHDEALRTIRHRLNHREANFLHIVERGIFEQPGSPYLPLLNMAGCELGDVAKMVHERGLEGTLKKLYEAGVYVTFEELKGREPIVRNGKEVAATPSDFDNPMIADYLRVESSGSTGPPTRVWLDLQSIADQALSLSAILDAHGILGAPTALLREILPAPSGIYLLLQHARLGRYCEKWFTPIARRDLRRPLKSRIATEFILTIGRLSGAPLPRPEEIEPDQFVSVARWAAGRAKTMGSAVVRSGPSLSLRVSSSAKEHGIDLAGTVFYGGGEPMTSAKLRELGSVGAKFISSYGTAEAGGRVAAGCARPGEANDNHILSDCAVLTTRPRRVPGTDISRDELLITGLRASAAKILLNVASDDYGVIKSRDCGCALEELGYTDHLTDIFSFSKLTGEGITLVGSGMVKILEEVLPARFGGSSLDYQLIEEEEEKGVTKLSIIVSPRVQISDEKQIIDEVLAELGRTNRDMERAILERAATLRVKRMEPIETGRNKVMPLAKRRR